MKTIRSPSNIEALIHFYCKPEPHPRQDAPAIQEVIEQFLKMGVIKQDENRNVTIYKTTPLGDAWVQALLRVPPPKRAFIDDHGHVLNVLWNDQTDMQLTPTETTY